MALATQNPELWLSITQGKTQYSNAALQAELHSMYCQKAHKVGMTLDGYCQRFGIKQTWRQDGKQS